MSLRSFKRASERGEEDVPLEQAPLLHALLGTPSAAPSRQPAVLQLVFVLARLCEPVRVQDSLGGGLARGVGIESHPIFSVPRVKGSNGGLLLRVEV